MCRGGAGVPKGDSSSAWLTEPVDDAFRGGAVAGARVGAGVGGGAMMGHPQGATLTGLVGGDARVRVRGGFVSGEVVPLYQERRASLMLRVLTDT